MRRATADQRSEIREGEAARSNAACKKRHIARDIDRKSSMQVAFAHRPLEIREAVKSAVALERARDMIRRGAGQRDFGQVIEIGKVVSRDGRGRRVMSEIEGASDAALNEGSRRARADIGSEVIRSLFIDMDERRAVNFRGENLSVQRAVADQFESVTWMRRRLPRATKPFR